MNTTSKELDAEQLSILEQILHDDIPYIVKIKRMGGARRTYYRVRLRYPSGLELTFDAENFDVTHPAKK